MPRLVFVNGYGQHVVVGQYVGPQHVGFQHVGLQQVGFQQVGLQQVGLQHVGFQQVGIAQQGLPVRVIQSVPPGDHPDCSYKGPGKVAGKPGLRMIEVWGSVVKDLGPYPGQ